MKIKCSEEEKQWLIKHIGKEKTENYPWNAGKDTDEDIGCEIEYLILREGFDDEMCYNDFGWECQRIHDSLLEQNSKRRRDG